MAAERVQPFPFGLNPEQEARAESLHRESIIFDMLAQYAGSELFAHYPDELRTELDRRLAEKTSHAAMLTEAIYWPFELAARGKSDLIRDWLLSSGITCGVYSIEDALEEAADPLSSQWDVRLVRYAQLPWLRYVTTAAEIREAKRDGVVAMYANFQPTTPLARNADSIEAAHRKGLRSLMLTYNRMDHVGVGCTERVDAGLSMFGVEVVDHCNELGIMVDVSHCGHLTTLDACRHSRKPVNANHTSARGVYAHARSKSDEELKAVAETGGIIGVVAVPHFLSNREHPSMEEMLDHIDYIVNLVGGQHVALGTDWPWPVPDRVLATALGPAYSARVGFRPEDRIDRTKRLQGFRDCRDLRNITRGLVARGYVDDSIRGILGENALRVFEEVCG